MKTRHCISASAAILAMVAMAGPVQAVDPYKDLIIEKLSVEQKEWLDILTPSSLPQTPSSSSPVMLTAALDRADGTYRPGEEVALTIETTKDAYVWVFDTGTSGNVHQLFPNEYATDNFIRAGRSVTLPDADAKYQFVVSPPAGFEMLTVFASTDDKPLTQDLIDRETGAGPFLALAGTAASVAKDLQIVIADGHPNSVTHHEVFRIVE